MNRAGLEGYWKDVYADRARGDAAAMAKRFAPGAYLQINGFPPPMPGAERLEGESVLESSLKTLIDEFTFLESELVNSVVEEDKAAIHWRAKVRHNPSGEVRDTGVLDLFVLKDGKIASYTQFCDTALVLELLGH